MEVTQSDVDSWAELFDDFSDAYDRIFRPNGVDKHTALLLWYANLKFNQLGEDIENLTEVLNDRYS